MDLCDVVNIISLPPITPTSADPRRCTTCRKAATTTPLSRCARCGTACYCTRSCQLTDWKAHKQTCGKPARDFPPDFQWFNHPFFAAAAAATETGGVNDLHALTRYAVVRHVGLDSAAWLNTQDRASVHSRIIDAYRIRMQEENGVFPGVFPFRDYQPVPHFQRFLELATSAGCLPGWWHEYHTQRCVRIATREDGGACVLRPITTLEFQERYGYDEDADWRLVVTQLRRVAKQVYGSEAKRPRDMHFLEGLPYIRRNREWGVVRLHAPGVPYGRSGSSNWSAGG